jgi:gliding motility-associated-like protein
VRLLAEEGMAFRFEAPDMDAPPWTPETLVIFDAIVEWSPDYNIDNIFSTTPTVSPLTDTIYTMTVATANCKASSSVKVIVLTELTIPNIFSPNGDTYHDKWVIGNIEDYPTAQVEIFNRYGQFVFKSTKDYSLKPWDGTYNNNGQLLPVGTYFYIINLENDKAPLSGSISIVR